MTKFRKDYIDLSGNKYNRLLVIKRVDVGKRGTYYECLCDCGNTTVVRSNSLKAGKTKSCGCYHSDIKRKMCLKRNTTHGLKKHPMYKVWEDMKSRCYRKSSTSYNHYGGRGIKVCDGWLNSFENFYEDMSETFTEGLEIDRIDVDGNYTKDNCRWVTRSQNIQNQRKRPNCTSMFKGVHLSKRSGKWQASICKNGKNQYIGIFDSEDDAALAYNEKALELFGKYAYLNKIKKS